MCFVDEKFNFFSKNTFFQQTLHRLIAETPKVLVQDWFKDSQSRNRVKSAINDVLDKELPESYDKDTFKKKRNRIFDLIYSYASGMCDIEEKSFYAASN